MPGPVPTPATSDLGGGASQTSGGRCGSCRRRLAPGATCPRHPWQPPAPTPRPDRRAPQVTGYQPVRWLGSGGFGQVWAALDADGREVALKVARYRDDDRFPREAAALRRLGAPTGPALLADGTTSGGRPFLALELLHGRSLGAALAALPEGGALPAAGALAIVEPLCAAVDRLHAAGIIHRDLKPENVFLCDGGRVALLDLGLCRFHDDPADAIANEVLTRTGERLGTALYGAPEQSTDARSVDARADVYALGVMLFELLTGRVPFWGDSGALVRAHAAQRPPRPSQLAAVSAAVEEVVLRALAKDRRRRYESAGALAAALREAARPGDVTAAAAAPDAARPASSRRTIALIAVATTEAPARVGALVAADGGQVERAESGRVVVAFPGFESPSAGVAAAVRAARRLLAELAGPPAVIVHSAEVRLRERSGVTVVLGDAIDRAASWWQGAAASASAGVGLSAAASTLHDPSADPRFATSELAPVREHAVRLVGRAELVAALAADAREALAAGTPALVTLLGDGGAGKSRMLAAVSEALAGGAATPRTLSAASGGLLAELLRVGLELPAGRVDAAAVRAAAETRLGEEAATLWPAAALALGAIALDDPALAAAVAVPNALRVGASQAAGLALRALAGRAPCVLCIDDADRADVAALDAVERAVLAGAPAPLWILCAASPALVELRPLWGDRAGRASRHELAPLAGAAARDLVRELLHPAEHIPDAVTERIAVLTGGVPLLMVELAHALRAAGAVRQHPGASAWYVAADELLHVSSTPLADRLAERALAAVPRSLLPLAQVAALLGDAIDPDEVDAVRTLAAQDPIGDIDSQVGLARLVRFGLLRLHGDRAFAFRHPMLRDAVAARAPATTARLVHEAAYRHLAADASDPARLRAAAHAAAAGRAAEAAASYLALADDARARHAYVEAERCFTEALASTGDDAARRERALSGRGSMRYRLGRFADACADLRAACALAEARGAAAAAANLLLEEATALDWMMDYAAAAQCADRARGLIGGLGDAAVAQRVALAHGRTLLRAGKFAEAIPMLLPVADVAGAADYETRIIAHLMLVFALGCDQQLLDAERWGARALELCDRGGDLFHRAALLIARVVVWSGLQRPERSEQDLTAALATARSIGHPQMERFARSNLAEQLLNCRRTVEAAPHARRALELQLALASGAPDPIEALLLARIACADGDLGEARARLQWMEERCRPVDPGTSAELLARMVRLAVDGAPDEEWDALVAAAGGSVSGEERQEIERAAARAARRTEYAEENLS